MVKPKVRVLVIYNGVWYKGSWKNTMFNGKGYLRFPTGEYYEGEFVDHLMQGKGVMKWLYRRKI